MLSRLSDRGYLLSAGKIRYEDSTDKFLANQDVKELYFGGVSLPVVLMEVTMTDLVDLLISGLVYGSIITVSNRSHPDVRYTRFL